MNKKYCLTVGLALSATVLTTLPAVHLAYANSAIKPMNTAATGTWQHTANYSKGEPLNRETGELRVGMYIDRADPKTVVIASNGGQIESGIDFHQRLMATAISRGVTKVRFEGHVKLPADSSNFFTPFKEYGPKLDMNSTKPIAEYSGAADFSSVKNMHRMFEAVKSVTFNFDPAGLNFDSVTDTSKCFFNASDVTFTNPIDLALPQLQTAAEMFLNAQNIEGLTSISTGDKLTDIHALFENTQNTHVDVSQINTSKVVDMSAAFRYSDINPDVSDWDTSSVTDMSYVFSGTTHANPDVSRWDTSNVKNMKNLFAEARIANPNVSSWNVSQVQNMASAFSGADSAQPDVSLWDVAKVKDFSYMFFYASQANPNIANWNISSGADISSMMEKSAYNNTTLPVIPRNIAASRDFIKTNQPINLKGTKESWQNLIKKPKTVNFADGSYIVYKEGAKNLDNIFEGSTLTKDNLGKILDKFNNDDVIHIELTHNVPPKTIVAIPDAPALKEELIFYKGDTPSDDLKDYFVTDSAVKSIEFVAGNSFDTATVGTNKQAKATVEYTSGAKRIITIDYTVKNKQPWDSIVAIPDAPELKEDLEFYKGDIPSEDLQTYFSEVGGVRSISFAPGSSFDTTVSGVNKSAKVIVEYTSGAKRILTVTYTVKDKQPWDTIVAIPDAPVLKEDLVFYKGDVPASNLKDYFNSLDEVKSITFADGSSFDTTTIGENKEAKVVVEYTSGAKRILTIAYTVKDKQPWSNVVPIPVAPELKEPLVFYKGEAAAADLKTYFDNLVDVKSITLTEGSSFDTATVGSNKHVQLVVQYGNGAKRTLTVEYTVKDKQPWSSVVPIPVAPELKENIVFYKGDTPAANLKDYFVNTDNISSIQFVPGSSFDTSSVGADKEVKLTIEYSSGAKRIITVQYAVKDKLPMSTIVPIPILPELKEPLTFFKGDIVPANLIPYFKASADIKSIALASGSSFDLTSAAETRQARLVVEYTSGAKRTFEVDYSVKAKTSDQGTQTDTNSTSDSGTQTDTGEVADSETQTDNPTMTDGETQTEGQSTSTTGTQTDKEESTSTGTQTEGTSTSTSSTQTDNKEVDSKETQTDVAPSVSSGTQTEEAPVSKTDAESPKPTKNAQHSDLANTSDPSFFALAGSSALAGFAAVIAGFKRRKNN